ncbi:HNH endonuclease [Citrobacter braakii]|jgi:5-methylcytosine-specific restriction protein A|uniref:HNH endonuclease n=1 Tax=Citrobacter braakii TaxID=57706 RepID=UPI001B821F66|nr:HNH endonuclease signature motif containing protein [Citrobacter braakii]MBR7613232.1 HNH endonuclease [Citrobacter braakii]MDL4470954.1 HNH endonuclease signature motif containing protein [Citrobacter braakii]MDL4502683.1 HNH endonuclease signature motif containing protein [Citrobacter braakii]
MNVRGNDGRQLNAACSIKKEDGCFGLVLESWGPSRRNSDYNEALEIIIERLQGKGVKCIIPYIASAPLRKNIPEIGGRRLCETGYFDIDSESAHYLRNELCKMQCYFSNTERRGTSSGNRTKRILISVEGFDDVETWFSIVEGDFSYYSVPTFDENELLFRTQQLANFKLSEPEGIQTPQSKVSTLKIYARSPEVKAWILQESKGICSLCLKTAPFRMPNGEPFLEVHHIIPLSEGGKDTPDNCAALCPNCHRAVHYSIEASSLQAKLKGLKSSLINTSSEVIDEI